MEQINQTQIKETYAIVGASGGIGKAIAQTCANHQWNTILIGRNPQRLQALKNHLETLGGSHIAWNNPWFSQEEAKTCLLQTNPSTLVITTGILHPSPALPHQRKEMIEANIEIFWNWGEAAAEIIEEENKPLKIAIIGSVAGDWGKKSNYIYGSTKGLEEIYTQGLQHRLHKKTTVTLIKPGPTKTRMARNLPNAANPITVAKDSIKAIQKGKRVAYSPKYWRIIMTIIKFTPKPLLEKTNL